MVIPPFARAAAPLHAGVFYYVEIAKQDGNVWTHKHTLGGSANPSLLITTDGRRVSIVLFYNWLFRRCEF